MKNFNLTQMLQGCSKRNEMTVSATNSGGGQTCQVKQQTRLTSVEEKWSEKEALNSTCLRNASVIPPFCLRYVAMIFAVLTLSIANIGTAWADTFTPDIDANVKTQDGITVSAVAATGKIGNKTSVPIFITQNGSLFIYSQLTNITAVSFDVTSSSGGTSTGPVNVDFYISQGGNLIKVDGSTFSTYVTSASTTNPSNSLSSLCQFTVNKDGESSATNMSVTFKSAVKAIELKLNGSNYARIKNLQITYNKSTLPTTYYQAKFSTTTDNQGTVVTGPAGSSITASSDKDTKIEYPGSSGEYYVKAEDNETTIDLGSGNTFQIGDEIVIDLMSSGNNKEVGYYYRTSTSTAVCTLTCKITNTYPAHIAYVVKSGDGIAGQQSMKLMRNAADLRVHTISVLRAAALSSCTAPTSPTNGDTGSTSQEISWTAPASAPEDGYLVAYSSATSTAPGTDVTATEGNYTVLEIPAGETDTTLRSLSASTTYYWWVRSVCDADAGTRSAWVAGTSFITSSCARVFKSGEKVYFKDQSSNFDFAYLWKVESGNVYASFWNAEEYMWSDPAGSCVEGSWDKENAIYEITVPGSGKTYTHVRFTRGNSDNKEWNTTTDEQPCEGKNLFYVHKTKYGAAYQGSWGNFTPAGKTVYFDNRNVTDWTTAYVRIGHGSDNSAWGAMTKVGGTRNLYSQSTVKYASHTDFSIANKAGWTGSHHIDQPENTYSDGSWSGSEYKMTKQTNYQEYAIESNTYICPKAPSVLEHECQFYQITDANSTTSSRIDANTTGMRLPAYTVTSSTTHCTVTMVKYTADDFSTSESLSSGGTVNPTQYIGVTVTPDAGYKFKSVSLTTDKYIEHTAAAAGVTGKYAIMANACVVTAVCEEDTYTITYKDGGDVAFSGVLGDGSPEEHTYGTPTPLVNPTKDGYSFGGWYTNSNFTGSKVTTLTADGYTANITLYAQWTKNVYLEMGDGWDSNSPWFAVYYYKDEVGSGWARMTLADECSDPAVYTAQLPMAVYDHLIFVRMDPSKDALSWDSKWTQTVDIIYPSTNFKYTITDIDGGADGKSTGSWGTYSVPTFTISYAGGTASESGSKSDETKTCDVNFTLPSSAVFTRTGYTQTGWALTENGSQSHALGGNYTTNADQTFYPVWTANTYDVDFSLTNVEYSSGDDEGTDVATYGTDFETVFTASTGYALPDDITVTIGGIDADDEAYIWDSSTGALTIYGAYILGDIEITIEGESEGCTPQSLSKVVLSVSGESVIGTATGYNYGQYTGTPEVKADKGNTDATNIDDKSGDETGYKMGSGGKSIVFAMLKGTSFQAGDKVRIGITRRNDTRQVDSKYNILTIYYGTDKSDADSLTTINTGGDNDNSAAEHEGAGFYEYTLTSADVTAIGSKKGIGLFRASENGENPYVYSVEIIGCREWTTCTAPTAVVAGSVTATGATFTITDAENTNNYEIYYSTSSTAPTADTSAIVSGISTKSRAVTGLTASTTYYYWVRSNCGGVTKSAWVAGASTFTTLAAATTYTVTYDDNSSTSGSVPTDDTDYEEGDVVTVKTNSGSLVKSGYTFVGWSTNATPSSGIFYPAGYKFTMGAGNVTLYAVWASGGASAYYYGSVSITAGALTPGSTGGHKGFFTNEGGTVATSSDISLSSTPSETGFYYESSTLTHTELSKSSNWNTSSTSKRTIRAFKFANNTSYTLALGSATATKITFYGKCGSASRILSVGGENWTSNSTKETFEYHEFTKVGNFTGNITIGSIDASSDNRGDFYGILVVTMADGGSSGYTVTFDKNGQGSFSQTISNVPSGSKIGAPIPAPTAAGYEFGGWYREAGCTNAWNFGSSTISKDTTLYAKWTTCAPTISVDPSGNTYTQGDDATALSVTASGDDLNYQWYTSEDGSADIQGSSAIPGATSASYTPSTSLLGTIYYFCVVSNTCGNAVSNKAAITVNDSKPAPTAVWTGTEESPKSGGKGWTITVAAKKNDGSTLWDGDITTSMLTASAGITLSGLTADNSAKTITGTYSLPAGVESPITFTLTLPATDTQSAASLDHEVSFTPCAGGVGGSYNVPVRKNYEKDASNNYRWVTPGAGEITYAVGSSISSAKAASTVASVFDSIMSNDKQYVWVKTYEANTKTIRLHVETSGANVSVSNLYKNTVYTAAAAKDRVSSDDYSVNYDGDGSAENTGAKGTHYMDITFDSPLDANDIICIMFSSSKVKAYGAVLTTVGDGGDQTTGLTWSNTQESGATLEKREDDADFTITAVRDATALKSLGLISYTSSNTAIATVNASTGQVHIADNIDFGSDDYKTTTITATLASSGCYKGKVITYTLKVTKYVCEDAPGTIEVTATNCSSQTLRVSGYEAGATIKWYRDGAEIPSATSAEYTATVAGEYYVVTHKTCDITSTNSINVSFTAATAEKIVDQWYVKNGRRTPDIALVQTTNATNFTVTSGGTITEIGGCTFELKDDGIIYLHGQKGDGSAPSDMTAGDMTITITVSGCSGALSGLDITIHKQAETAKPSVAFVVDGTTRAKGGTATSVSTAKTSERPLWTYLSSSFTLTGCNIYWSVDSKELREYYSQYDAIVVTDDPNTGTTGAGGVEYVKAFGTMVDVRPILTMEAYVGKYKDGGWHVYNADPSSPNPRQVEMKLECKNHDIFYGLNPSSDNVRTTTDEYDNEYWHVIMVDTTVAPYHNTSKDYKALPALQGFDPHKFDYMLGVGTIAEETLQGGVERQEEPAARMIILGIQNEAMAALTNEGKLIVKNAISYLLKTNMEDVNDCSNYFTNETGNGLWNDPDNWQAGKIPDFETRARILKPVTISGEMAIASRVDIAIDGTSKWADGTCEGSVTIAPDGALKVGGKIRTAIAPNFGLEDLTPTRPQDLIVQTSSSGQGALILDNSDGETQATVEMYSPSYQEKIEGSTKVKSYWSYVGVPITEVNIGEYFYGAVTYLYDETSGWIRKGMYTQLHDFEGIGLSLPAGNKETFYGSLASTEDKEIALTYTAGKGVGENMIGNSWTAPIEIANFEEDDFGDATPTVYVHNTGRDEQGNGGVEGGHASYGGYNSETAGQWITVPISTAKTGGYDGLKVIPAMNAFQVNTSTPTTLTLNYNRLVRKNTTIEDLTTPMRAPRRRFMAPQKSENEIEAIMRIRLQDEKTHTDVWLQQDPQFSEAFDNGWEAIYAKCDNRSAQFYALSPLGKMAFIALSDLEGTALGMAPSRNGNDYTFTFHYVGDEEFYLNDLKLQKSTLIDENSSYLFTYEEGDDANRFYVSRIPFDKPGIATGVTDLDAEAPKVQKVIYNDKLFIIRGGKVFSADGQIVR